MNVPFYLDAIWKSMSNIPWLCEQRKDVARASKYFLGLILVMSVIDATIFSKDFLSNIHAVMGKALEVAPELSIERKDGELKASGITEPFIFETVADGQPVLIYIDTTTSSAAIPATTLLESKEKKTFAIAVTSDMVRFIEGETHREQKITVADLPENSVIPYGKTVKRIQEFTASNRSLAIVIAISTLILFVFYTFAELIYLAFVVLVVWGVSHMKKFTWTFSEIFTVGLFAVTLPILLDEVFLLVGKTIPFLATAILIALLSLVIRYKAEDKPEQL